MASIYSIAEKCKYIAGKGNLQAISSMVIDAYATVVRNSWFENKAVDLNEVDGVFIYTFKNLVPQLDSDLNYYYIEKPSSAIRLPNELGINQVSFMQGQTSPFARINAGSLGLWSNLKSYALGGLQTYYEEGTRMYFPKMNQSTNGNILLKMAIALDTVDVEEELLIPPDVVDSIVSLVVEKLNPKESVKPENLT